MTEILEPCGSYVKHLSYEKTRRWVLIIVYVYILVENR